jgi:hypothetical protein
MNRHSPPTSVVLALSLTLAAIPARSSASPDTLKPGKWYEIPNTVMQDVSYAKEHGDTIGDRHLSSFHNITNYSSGALDTKRNQFVIWGGGHGGDDDDGVYIFDLNTLHWARAKDPTPLFSSDYTIVDGRSKYVPADGQAYMPDGSPILRHTYDIIQYVPILDKTCIFGGAAFQNFSYAIGLPIKWVDCFNSDTGRWETHEAPIAPNLAMVRSSAAYNSKNGLVYFQRGTGGDFASFNPRTKEWRTLSTYSRWLSEDLVSDIDTKRNRFVAIGQHLYMVDLNSSDPQLTLIDSPVRSDVATAPGFVYYPKIDKFVVWRGGSKLYTLDPETWQWSVVQLSPTSTATPPTSVGEGGVYGRFRYSPKYDAFIAIPDARNNVYAFKFDVASTAAQPPAEQTTVPAVHAPMLTLQASKTSITTGERVTPTWTNQYATSCRASGSWSGPQPLSGSITLTPGDTSSYFLSCTAGTTVSGVTVAVSPEGGGSNPGALTDPGGYVQTTSADQDFNRRCASPGVVFCDPLDSERVTGAAITAETPAATLPEALHGKYRDWRWAGANDTARAPIVMDTQTYASGDGSIRFTIPSQSSAGTAGYLQTNFSPDNSIQFGEGETFYVQWKQRFSCTMIYKDCDPTSPNYKKERRRYAATGGGYTAFKTIIINAGDDARLPYPTTSCTWQHIVLNGGLDDAIAGYHSCGWYAPFEKFTGYLGGSGQFDRQPGGDNSCMRVLDNPARLATWGDSDPNCVRYEADRWITFQVALTPYWQPDRTGDPKSNIKLWLTPEGGKTSLVIDYNFYDRGPEPTTNGLDSSFLKYGKIWLLPYMTNKDPNEVHPEAYTWYDEIIVSRSRIPDPT